MRSIALLTLLMAAPVAAATDNVTVELTNFHFTPSTPTFHHGQPYTLHIVNKASGGHDFVAPEFFAASVIAPADRAKVAGGKIEIDGGESIDIHLTAPARPGSYKLKCSHLFHATFGMTGAITVD